MNGLIALAYAICAFCFVAAALWRREDKKGELRKRLNVTIATDANESVDEWVAIYVIAFLCGIFLAVALGFSFVIGVSIGLGFCCATGGLSKHLETKRQKDMNIEMEGVLLDMAASLWTNPSVKTAIEAARDDAKGPMRNELAKTLTEIEHGINIDDALRRWGDRSPSDLVCSCVRMITVCRMTGGKLAPVLEQLARTTRERSAMEKEIRSLSAQPKVTATVVAVVPLVFLGLAAVINPAYVEYLWSPSGRLLIVYGAASIVTGFYILRKQADSIAGAR